LSKCARPATRIEILPDVLDYFSKCLIPLHQAVHYVAETQRHALHQRVNDQMAQIDPESLWLATTGTDLQKRLAGRSRRSVEWEARVWALSEALSREIPSLRICLLDPPVDGRLPPPLDVIALQGIGATADHLVPLRRLHWDGFRLFRMDSAFLPLAQLEVPHAQYWILKELIEQDLTAHTSVRLDPLLHGSPDQILPLAHKDWFRDCHLEGDQFRHLKAEVYLPWPRSTAEPGIVLTDMAWTPQGSEVHFRCEEVPSLDRLSIRGTRHVHAVYDSANDEFVRFVASIRTITRDAWGQRVSGLPVSMADDWGRRHKVIEIMAPLPRAVFAKLCAQFFVWNGPVQRYFGADG
jgi:hypothetical protein